LTKPLLGIIARGDVPEPLHRLLVACCADALPATYDPAHAALFECAVVASPELLDDAPRGVRLAVWVDAVTDMEALAPRTEVAAIVASNDEIVAAAGARGILVAPGAEPQLATRFVPPAVRARLRAARGLPAHAVAVIDDDGAEWCDEPVADDVRDTALACAAVAVVRGAWALRAMAWGTPLVTDAATCAALGAVDGRDLVVARADPCATVEALLDDSAQLARLSWKARRFYERHHDLRSAVTQLLGMLHIPNVMTPPTARLQAVFTQMWTPSDAPAFARAYDRLATVVPRV